MSVARHVRPPSRRRLAAVAVATAVLTTFATGCSDDDATPAPSASPSTTASTPLTSPSSTLTPTRTATRTPAGTATATTAPALPGSGTKPVLIKGNANATALLTDVRLAGHAGFDRFVLEFDGGLPDVSVRYVRPPITQDGSGNTVSVDGDAFLQIRTTPASGVDLTTEDATPTYTGSKRVRAGGTESVEEAVLVGDFEAYLTWVLGIDDGRRPFVVRTLSNPTRVVVDVAYARG